MTAAPPTGCGIACACCKRAFAAVTTYRPKEGEAVDLCAGCCTELLRDLVEDGSPGFLDILFRRVRYR